MVSGDAGQDWSVTQTKSRLLQGGFSFHNVFRLTYFATDPFELDASSMIGSTVMGMT